MSERSDHILRASGGLSTLFGYCAHCTPDTLFNRELTNSYLEKETATLLGQASGSVVGGQPLSPVAKKTGTQNKQQEKNRKQAAFADWLIKIAGQIQRLAEDVAGWEAEFQKRDGEEWREKLALRILDKDDIPQRCDGENMDDYRERLEVLLIQEMLDDDGKIKNEYLNDPDLADYAQWAQKKNNLNRAKTVVADLENPNTSDERRQEILARLESDGNFEEVVFAGREAQEWSSAQGHIRNAEDAGRDAAGQDNQGAEAAEFLKLSP